MNKLKVTLVASLMGLTLVGCSTAQVQKEQNDAYLAQIAAHNATVANAQAQKYAAFEKAMSGDNEMVQVVALMGLMMEGNGGGGNAGYLAPQAPRQVESIGSKLLTAGIQFGLAALPVWAQIEMNGNSTDVQMASIAMNGEVQKANIEGYIGFGQNLVDVSNGLAGHIQAPAANVRTTTTYENSFNTATDSYNVPTKTTTTTTTDNSTKSGAGGGGGLFLEP